jgi:molecular chaperone GrpE
MSYCRKSVHGTKVAKAARNPMKNRIRKFFSQMNAEEKAPETPQMEAPAQSMNDSGTQEQIVAEGPVTTDESLNPEALNAEEATLTNWEAKYQDINDRYLRLYSEFDNYRKRTIKERADLIKTAGSDIFAAILPVLDDFERASKALETSGESNPAQEGMLLISQKLKGILTNRGLEEMNAKGQEFDADLHEAITQIPAPEESLKGKVIDELEKGYSLNGKVIRFAKVVVGS